MMNDVAYLVVVMIVLCNIIVLRKEEKKIQ
jgi:hypothetical protein